jgi:hypothetical protein
MSGLANDGTEGPPIRPNGPAAAAVLAAGVGSFTLGILTIATSHSEAMKTSLAFYKPTGPLSGVTTVAIGLWLALWILLDRLWFRRNLQPRTITIVSIALVGLSVLATFPPIGDLF